MFNGPFCDARQPRLHSSSFLPSQIWQESQTWTITMEKYVNSLLQNKKQVKFTNRENGDDHDMVLVPFYYPVIQ